MDLSRALLATALLLSMALLTRGAYDVSRLLATKTRYAQRLLIPNAPSVYDTPDPPGYHASLLWVVARHGTRWPTDGRMRQMEELAATFKDAGNTKEFPWMQDWVSPTIGLEDACGELHPVGESEMWSLATRMRARFPSVTRSDYLPRRYPIVSTQVPRAAASASAFAAGFFPSIPVTDDHPGPSAKTDSKLLRALLTTLKANDAGNGDAEYLEPGPTRPRRRPQAIAVTMAPKEQDPLLRFFDMCPAYAQREEWMETWLTSWLLDQWGALAPAVGRRLGMRRPLAASEVDALWTLCQYEAGVLGETGRACKAFTPDQLAVMEWLDDVDLLESQAWGSPLNYRIAVPLLQDLRDTLQMAAAGHTAKRASGGAAHARLLFAHCETLVPFATLMGLFEPELPPTPWHVQQPSKAELQRAAIPPQDEALRVLHESDATDELHVKVQQDQRQRGPAQRLRPPEGWFPRTPLNESRAFRGGRIAPFGANAVFVLYKRTNHTPGGRQVSHRVRLIWNEQVVPMPQCQPVGPATAEDPTANLDCTLEEFMATTAAVAGDTLDQWCWLESTSAT